MKQIANRWANAIQETTSRFQALAATTIAGSLKQFADGLHEFATNEKLIAELEQMEREFKEKSDDLYPQVNPRHHS